MQLNVKRTMPLQNFMQLPWPLYNSLIKHHQGRVLKREPCVFHLNMLNHIFFSFTWNRLFVPLHSSWTQWNSTRDLAKYCARAACSMTKQTICQRKDRSSQTAWDVWKSNDKDGNTKIRLQLPLPSGSYCHVLSLCCAERGKNTAKHGKQDLC